MFGLLGYITKIINVLTREKEGLLTIQTVTNHLGLALFLNVM